MIKGLSAPSSIDKGCKIHSYRDHLRATFREKQYRDFRISPSVIEEDDPKHLAQEINPGNIVRDVRIFYSVLFDVIPKITPEISPSLRIITNHLSETIVIWENPELSRTKKRDDQIVKTESKQSISEIHPSSRFIYHFFKDYGAILRYAFLKRESKAEKKIFEIVLFMRTRQGIDLPSAALVIAYLFLISTKVPVLDEWSWVPVKFGSSLSISLRTDMPLHVEIELRSRALMINPDMRVHPPWTPSSKMFPLKLVSDLFFITLVRRFSPETDNTSQATNRESLYHRHLMEIISRTSLEFLKYQDEAMCKFWLNSTDWSRTMKVESAAYFLSDSEMQSDVRKVAQIFKNYVNSSKNGRMFFEVDSHLSHLISLGLQDLRDWEPTSILNGFMFRSSSFLTFATNLHTMAISAPAVFDSRLFSRHFSPTQTISIPSSKNQTRPKPQRKVHFAVHCEIVIEIS